MPESSTPDAKEGIACVVFMCHGANPNGVLLAQPVRIPAMPGKGSPMELVNLTPHPLNFIGAIGAEILTVPPSGTVARCVEERTEGVPLPVTQDTGMSTLIPVCRKAFGGVEGLPEPLDGIAYVVSALAAQAAWAAGRDDVYTVADPVRDDSGRIIGCRGLGANPEYGRRRDDDVCCRYCGATVNGHTCPLCGEGQ